MFIYSSDGLCDVVCIGCIVLKLKSNPSKNKISRKATRCGPLTLFSELRHDNQAVVSSGWKFAILNLEGILWWYEIWKTPATPPNVTCTGNLGKHHPREALSRGGNPPVNHIKHSGWCMIFASQSSRNDNFWQEIREFLRSFMLRHHDRNLASLSQNIPNNLGNPGFFTKIPPQLQSLHYVRQDILVCLYEKLFPHRTGIARSLPWWEDPLLSTR